MAFIDRINQFLKLSFYALFLVTPLLMTNVNHELFEFNKMLFVYVISALVFLLWGLKMIHEKRFFVRRTIFDIPILLFVLSQILSTVFSMDPHTSFWGYYSRFNGGLLSIICYVFLYYALVSNFFGNKDDAKSFALRLLIISLVSGFVVTLWGLPGHFGFDPTCLVFGYGLNTSCWTEAFDPMSRIFSTLGQPNWLAAYLSILLPISLAFFIRLTTTNKDIGLKDLLFTKKGLFGIWYLITGSLFYIAITWTSSQSGFIGLWAGLITFLIAIKLTAFRKSGFDLKKYLRLRSIRIASVFLVGFIAVSFLLGNPFPRLQSFSLPRILENAKPAAMQENETPTSGPSLEYNITGSGDIRLIVWRGALDIFKSYPIIGSGVETFAYAYYQFRPVEHNLTSEWDYLYNKAHNEYLNYLATTGILGFGTYMTFIILFLIVAYKYFISQKTITNVLIPASLTGGFVSIIVSNFFGFSVVLANLYLIVIPALFLMYTGKRNSILSFPKTQEAKTNDMSPVQYFVATVVFVLSIYWTWQVINMWNADKEYALGYNYNKIEEYITANPFLEEAHRLRPSEDLFKSELSTNLASLALSFAQDNQLENASMFANRAKTLSDEVERDNPNNVVFYKTRTRTLFTLSQIQPELLTDAYSTILKALVLAPTDAKIMYNKALIEEVQGNPTQALSTLNETLKLKENYLDAQYRKAIVLMSLSESEKDSTKSQEYKDQAKATLTFITEKLAPDFPEAQELLKTLE